MVQNRILNLKNYIFLMLIPLLLLGVFYPSLAKAQMTGGNKEITITNPLENLEYEGEPVDTIEGLIWVVIHWLRKIGIVIAVGFLVWGGFKFVTAAGDSTKVTDARKLMQYAVIGVAILIGAEIIVNAVLDFMNSPESVGTGEGEVSTLYDKFITLTEYFYSVVLALSIIYIAKGGLDYVTAGGDKTEISDAKKSTFYGLIGLTIILGVWLIIVLISNILEVAVPKFPFT